MKGKTKISTLIPAGSNTADVTGDYVPLEPQAEAIVVWINLTAIARTTTGTLQVTLEASYDDGATFEPVAKGAAATAAAQERFIYQFHTGIGVVAATAADATSWYQASPQTAPTATNLRHHLKPHGYRAIADMAGDTTSFNVTVTLRQALEV